MDTIETSWDTDETSRIVANDEGLYNTVLRLERTATSTSHLADMMEEELSYIVESNPYSDISMDAVDWHAIATEYTEEE